MINLCLLSDLPEGQCRSFRLGDKSIFAVHDEQGIYVYLNRCPHLGIELEWVANQFLNHDATLIQCATHGALFLIDTGLCIAGPCQGQQLQAVPAHIEQGCLIIEELPNQPSD